MKKQKSVEKSVPAESPARVEDTLEKVLAERGARYGSFEDHARCTQQMKGVMHMQRNWDFMDYDHCEALHMIVHKIGRILCGDPNYADSWVDIAGYAKLVADRLSKTKA